jgi:hypothetical protein
LAPISAVDLFSSNTALRLKKKKPPRFYIAGACTISEQVQLTLTSIFFGLASSVFGSVTVSTPSLVIRLHRIRGDGFGQRQRALEFSIGPLLPVNFHAFFNLLGLAFAGAPHLSGRLTWLSECGTHWTAQISGP